MLLFSTVMFAVVLFGICTEGKVQGATLVAQWEFDGDFTAANDSLYDGIASPGVTFVCRADGQAANFDGGFGPGNNNPDIDHVDSSELTSASEFNGGFSIMGWINARKLDTILSHDQSSSPFFGFSLFPIPDGRVILVLRDKTQGTMQAETPFGTVTSNKWTHVTTTWDGDPSGSGIKFYINGLLVPTILNPHNGIFVGLNSTGSLPVRIGATFADGANNMAGIDGSLDHISLWKGVLTQQEILADHNNTKTPAISSGGFQSPMDKGPVTVKKNRVLPLKAEFLDENGIPVTDLDVTAPPVLQVIYDSGNPATDPIDVTKDALSAGHGTDGNQFEYDSSSGRWKFNLMTKNYTAIGTYIISMVAGSECEYIIESVPTATFVLNE